ncbi:MAG: thioredoxin-disulfide reductase [Planctomycetota bacterium]
MSRHVVIIGSGPAGYTAALYTARANLKPKVYAGSVKHGGQLMLTTEVENYPGFPEGIQGPELMENFQKQAARFEAEILFQDVVSVDFSQRPFVIRTHEEEERAQAVIIATGASARMLGLPSEQKLLGHGVSTCATCDGFFFRGKEIAVVGGGDSALEEATFLTRFASKVYLVHRRDQLRGSKIMQDKALANPKITPVWDSEIAEVLGVDEGVVRGVSLRNVKTGVVREQPLSAVFVAIGHVPNTELFRGQLELHDNGYLKTHQGTRTSVDGVFACGDVQDFTYRQAVTAAGTGCMAAIDAERWLEAGGH